MAVINTNIKALFSENALANTGKAQSLAMQKLATGKRINSARDDAAGIAISTRMTQQIRGLNKAVHNAGDAINLIQTAEGATNSITDMMQRMRELAVQAANDTNDDAQRSYLDLEFQQLKQQIVQVASNTEWNGFPVLDGTAGERVGEMPVYKTTSNNQYGDVLLSPTTTRVIEGTASGEQQTVTFDTSSIPAIGSTSESSLVTFPVAGLGNNQSVTVAGLTFTASTTVIRANLAAAFASLANGATTGAGVGGTYSGTFAGFTSGLVSSGAVTFTSASLGNITNISVASNTVSLVPVVNTTDGINASGGFTGTRTFKFAGETINLQWDAIKNSNGSAVDPAKMLAQIKQQLESTDQFGSGSGRAVAISGNSLVLTYAAKDLDAPSAQLVDASNDGFFKVGSLSVSRNAVTNTVENFDNNGRFLRSGNLVIEHTDINNDGTLDIKAVFTTPDNKSVNLTGTFDKVTGKVKFLARDGINSIVISDNLTYVLKDADSAPLDATSTAKDLDLRNFKLSVDVSGSIPAMRAGDLLINGVEIGGSFANDDPYSPINNANGSAIAKAAAINRKASKGSGPVGESQAITLSGTPIPGVITVGGVSVELTAMENTPALAVAKIAEAMRTSAQFGQGSGRTVNYAAGSTIIGVNFPVTDGQVNAIDVQQGDTNLASVTDTTRQYSSSSAGTGVFAKVNENVMSGRAMSGDSVVKGNVFINGYASAGITTVLNNPSETRANVVRAINLISNKTGVKAIDTGTEVKGITLTAADGRNIEVSFETDADKNDFGTRIGLRQGVQSSTISLESKIKAPVVLTSGSTGDITRSGLISGNFSKNESVTTTSLRPAVKANIDQLEAIKYTGSVSNSDSFSLTINGKTYSYTAPATGTVTLQMVRNGLISAVNADTSLGVNASGGRTPTEIYLNANVAGTAFTLSNSKSNTTTTVTTSELRANYISEFKALLLNDLIINGVKIPASNGADDSYSNSIATSSDPASSAIAISAAINSQSVLTGVMAKANGAEIKGVNTDTSLPISSGPTTQSLFINGTDIRVQFIQGELTKNRLDKVAEAINTHTGEHGVAATNNGQGISLKSDGRNLSVWFDSNVKDLSAANFGLDEGGAIARSVDVSFNGNFANTDTASLVINGVRVASAANAAATASGFANVMKTAVDAAITSGSIKNVNASVNGDVLTIKSTVPGTNFKVYWASMGGVFPVGSSMSINYVTPNDSGNTRTTGIFNAIASSTAAKTVYGSVSLVKQPPHDKNKYAPMNIKPFTVSTGSNGFDAQSNFSVLGFHEGDFGGRASSDMDPPRVGRLAFQVGSGAGQLVTIDLADFGKDGPITSEITGDVDQNLDQRKSRINTREDASDMLTKLDLTMDRVNAVRSNMGAVMNRLDHIISNVTNVSTNMSKSRSVIEDADYATASSELAKAQIMQQAATAVLAQANTSQQTVLKLLA